jgi:Fe-S-cluster containining protein
MSVVETCGQCDAYCCRHVALQIDKPRCKSDYDKVRWYLLHEKIWVSIDRQGNWILEFRTTCRNIDQNNRCADYENRPKICREYPDENELCERQTEELSYTHLFSNVSEFDRYLDEKGVDWKWKKT